MGNEEAHLTLTIIPASSEANGDERFDGRAAWEC